MRRFLGHVAVFLALQMALFAALDAFYMRRFGEKHFLAAWREKSARLEAMSAPRVLLVGGSSNAFGVDSGMLERASGRPVVNLALNAGLGLRFILNQAAAAVRPGDLVILTPEYWLLERRENFDAPTVFVALRVTPGTARFVPLSMIPRLLDQGLVPVSDRLRALSAFSRGEKENPAYTREAFDRWGDAVGHHSYGSLLGGDQHAWVPPAEDAEKACRVLAWFADEVRARGAELVIVPPPIPADDYAVHRAALVRLWRRVGEATRADVVLVRKTFAREQFFDTVYHLTREGRKSRTRAIAAWVRRSSAERDPGD
jgi:hypothetical protein